MKTRALSAIGVVIASLLPAWIGNWTFVAFIAVIMSVAYLEVCRLLDLRDSAISAIGVVIIAAAAVMPRISQSENWIPVVIACAFLAPLALTLRDDPAETSRPSWALTIGAIAYLALPAFAAVSLRHVDHISHSTSTTDWMSSARLFGAPVAGFGWFILALWITWMSDTFAYLVGRSIGRQKLVPTISPNKTIEGALGGLVAGGSVAWLIDALFALPLSGFEAVFVGSILSILGIVGDLVESHMKRRAGVKDSGNVIPGHGGMLDRIDALIFVLIGVWALQPLLT